MSYGMGMNGGRKTVPILMVYSVITSSLQTFFPVGFVYPTPPAPFAAIIFSEHCFHRIPFLFTTPPPETSSFLHNVSYKLFCLVFMGLLKLA